MCCQPGNRSGLSASETDRRRRYSIRMQPGWNYARSTARPKRLASRTGAGRQGNIFSFPSREKNVLDFSSYRPGVNAQISTAFDQLHIEAFVWNPMISVIRINEMVRRRVGLRLGSLNEED